MRKESTTEDNSSNIYLKLDFSRYNILARVKLLRSFSTDYLTCMNIAATQESKHLQDWYGGAIVPECGLGKW